MVKDQKTKVFFFNDTFEFFFAFYFLFIQTTFQGTAAGLGCYRRTPAECPGSLSLPREPCSSGHGLTTGIEDMTSIHDAEVIGEGEKWIMTRRWMREIE